LVTLDIPISTGVSKNVTRGDAFKTLKPAAVNNYLTVFGDGIMDCDSLIVRGPNDCYAALRRGGRGVFSDNIRELEIAGAVRTGDNHAIGSGLAKVNLKKTLFAVW